MKKLFLSLTVITVLGFSLTTLAATTGDDVVKAIAVAAKQTEPGRRIGTDITLVCQTQEARFKLVAFRGVEDRWYGTGATERYLGKVSVSRIDQTFPQFPAFEEFPYDTRDFRFTHLIDENNFIIQHFHYIEGNGYASGGNESFFIQRAAGGPIVISRRPMSEENVFPPNEHVIYSADQCAIQIKRSI